MTTDTLGDRMKTYEAATRHVLPRRTYALIRCDGRAFHSYLRGAARPFDEAFMADMDAVAVALCQEISGAVLAYVQSDEVSVLAVDFTAPGTQPWFGGVIAKVASVSAAIASVELNARRPGRAVFDSRVFTIADPVDVGNYLLWRQRDCVRNSITMAAQSKFSHNRLHGVNSSQMQELLFAEHGINWNNYPDGCKRGRLVTKASGPRTVTFTDTRTDQVRTVVAERTWWEPAPAPHFTRDTLAALIPTMPTGGPTP